MRKTQSEFLEEKKIRSKFKNCKLTLQQWSKFLQWDLPWILRHLLPNSQLVLLLEVSHCPHSQEHKQVQGPFFELKHLNPERRKSSHRLLKLYASTLNSCTNHNTKSNNKASKKKVHWKRRSSILNKQEQNSSLFFFIIKLNMSKHYTFTHSKIVARCLCTAWASTVIAFISMFNATYLEGIKNWYIIMK